MSKRTTVFEPMIMEKYFLRSLSILKCVVLLASLVNSVIYCWRSRQLRRVFLEILHLRTQGLTRNWNERNAVAPTA